MQRIRFTFSGAMIKEPVIYQLGRDYHVVTSIRRADIQENMGWVILELEGDQADIDGGLEWVRSLGVRVDPVLGDVVEG
jgi:ABC-type methionine transport system ATPase subunit